MKLNLKNRFLIPSLALIIIGMGISTAVGYFVAARTIEENITGQLSTLLELTDQRVSSFYNDRKADISSWASQKIVQTAVQNNFVGKSAREAANEMLAKIKKDYVYYDSISIADAEGNAIASTEIASIGKVNIADRPYFQESMKGAFAVSSVLISRTTGRPSFVISVPVREKDQVTGVLRTTIDLSVFTKVYIDPVKVGKEGFAFIVQSDGVVLAHPDQTKIVQFNVKETDFGREILARQKGVLEYAFNGKKKIASFTRNKDFGWMIAVTSSNDEMLAPVKRLAGLNGGVAAGVVVLTAVIILLVVNATVRPLNRIAATLREGALEVASASGHAASSSEQLSNGASQQAAAIEETSSSLEEMTSMTRQNTENANRANAIMSDAGRVIETANRSMAGLAESMKEITAASEQTRKIVKTIDEIAFQTNLLALNAAVEAARAGEAGAGFAVVAEEVRNLAMRAAQAAKSTESLIGTTVQKIGEGSELVKQAEQGFQEITGCIGRSGEIIGEIAAASEEQAQGIQQINKAVSEMDGVTQQNSASAEESAAAAEQMSVRAERMKESVEELLEIVVGSSRVRSDHLAETKTTVAVAKCQTVESYRARERGRLPRAIASKANGKAHPAVRLQLEDGFPMAGRDKSFADF